MCSDIDFEYPTAGAQAQGFASLLSELRTALNNHAAKKGETNPYQITVGHKDYRLVCSSHIKIRLPSQPDSQTTPTFWCPRWIHR